MSNYRMIGSELAPKAGRSVLLVISACLLLLLVPTEILAQGCSMCKATVETDAANNANGMGASVGAGLNKGIIFLMVVPYILLFLFFRKRIVAFWKEFASAKG